MQKLSLHRFAQCSKFRCRLCYNSSAQLVKSNNAPSSSIVIAIKNIAETQCKWRSFNEKKKHFHVQLSSPQLQRQQLLDDATVNSSLVPGYEHQLVFSIRDRFSLLLVPFTHFLFLAAKRLRQNTLKLSTDDFFSTTLRSFVRLLNTLLLLSS